MVKQTSLSSVVAVRILIKIFQISYVHSADLPSCPAAVQGAADPANGAAVPVAHLGISSYDLIILAVRGMPTLIWLW